MLQRLFSSPGFSQVPLLSLCLATLVFLWGLYAQQEATSRKEALQAKAAEHLNLASLTAENLRQLVDRAQVIARITQDETDSLRLDGRSIVRMLAEDPVLKRMSLYDPEGRLRSSSHADELQQLPEQWLQEFQVHLSVYGLKPYLPSLLVSQSTSSSNWRLPFLLPLANPTTGVLESIMQVQLDIGYLSVLFRNTDLGESGLVRLLDNGNHERLHISNSGVVMTGTKLSPDLPKGAQNLGRMTQHGAGKDYQSLYSRVHERGFILVVSQLHEEILSSQQLTYGRQFWMNLGMTLIILGGMLWALRASHRRQEAFRALEQAQRVNQGLIDRLEEEHRRSSHAAATDHLSGLHNRRQFMENATTALARQRSQRRLMAILFIDMDRFKKINDSLGHKVGDLLLQAVAGRISRALDSEDQAARFGGDEFVVLLAGDRTVEQIDAWVRALVEKLSAVYSLDDQEVNTSPSIGVSICPRDGQSVDDLIRFADAAMYSAKQSGRGQYRFFDSSLNLADIEEFALEQTLGTALSEHQFVLHYQPQIRLDTLQVVGYEALVRWQHPQFGLLYPDRFISLAERCGFIVALGWEVLRLALDELVRWQAQGRSTQMAVNVSALQLRQSDFSERLLLQLEQRGIDCASLELEITETVVLDAEGQAIEHLQRLRDAGVHISLDDFGQGYAGFAHLHALPLSRLKIDRALIAPLSNTYDDNPIVTSTIILAKRLGLEVVAEGVETREQLVYLKLAGCDLAQGYHFSRPLSLEQLEQYPPFASAVEAQCAS